jgi:hypothetical protein
MRRFDYVGPREIRARAAGAPPGVPIVSRDALRAWLRDQRESVTGDGGWATYVVDLSGRLLVAPRRTEHVACASGAAVLAAGEIQFTADGQVAAVTNNSTGYCPAEDCWAGAESAMDSAGLAHPPGFTFLAHFRRCPRCGERNLVKDDWYVCALCGAELPAAWNFA